MKKSNIYIGLFIAVLIGIGVIGFAKVSKANSHITEGKDNYTISETWELPSELDEVSGIVWVDNHTMACVQDEDGVIYIYDLDEKSITDEIPFAGNGDYEGIARHKDDLFIIQSDGLLYEVKDWRKVDKKVSSYQTGFKSSNNMESLAYSIKDDCLLTIPKDKDSKDNYKGVYKIPLNSKKPNIANAAYQIDMNATALKQYKNKKLFKTFNPSEIAVHPQSKEIYILEGKDPKLMILDPQGNLKNVYKLDELNFPQPEGMTFSETGELYISNESAGNTPTIHLVDINFAK